MHPVGFEPTISAGKRPQTYATDRAVTGTDKYATALFCTSVLLIQERVKPEMFPRVPVASLSSTVISN